MVFILLDTKSALTCFTESLLNGLLWSRPGNDTKYPLQREWTLNCGRETLPWRDRGRKRIGLRLHGRLPDELQSRRLRPLSTFLQKSKGKSLPLWADFSMHIFHAHCSERAMGSLNMATAATNWQGTFPETKEGSGSVTRSGIHNCEGEPHSRRVRMRDRKGTSLS